MVNICGHALDCARLTVHIEMLALQGTCLMEAVLPWQSATRTGHSDALKQHQHPLQRYTGGTSLHHGECSQVPRNKKPTASISNQRVSACLRHLPGILDSTRRHPGGICTGTCTAQSKRQGNVRVEMCGKSPVQSQNRTGNDQKLFRNFYTQEGHGPDLKGFKVFKALICQGVSRNSTKHM